MKELKKYSIELLASMIGERVIFEDRDYEVWEKVEFEFKECTAVITGVMYSQENIAQETEFYNADLSDVIFYFDDFPPTVLYADEIIELEVLIKLYKS